ncbi:MAG TPA: LLM class flavin-dependent oxidoreductase [Blastocatellia bacterium]|nr:LLM class flavin-dependent oxidoreductase [Blastocatellia bacterium]
MRKLGLYAGRLPGFDKTGFDRRELIECVRAADGAGYDSFWLPESWEHDAFPILTELALCTKKIALCTGVINIFSRSPALIAMSAATIDEISDGRFRLGLGTSGARVIEDFHGLRYEKALARMRETILIVRTLLAGERAELDGDCFRVTRFRLGFRPLRATIPIYVAALTSGGIRQAGELADGWLPTYWPAEQLPRAIAEIAAGARERTDKSVTEIAPFLTVVVSDDPARARHNARLPIAYYVGGMGKYYHASVSRLGFAVDADRIRELWTTGRPRDAIRSVPDEMVNTLAICGNVDQCRAGIRKVYEHGGTLPIVPIPSDGTTNDKCRIIESLIE